MELFAYADETEFKRQNSDSNSVVGSGILISKNPIGPEIIKEALNNLQNDCEKNKSDILTLEKGYFHASTDSNKAHIHFSKAINKHIEGSFNYSYFEKHKEEPWKKQKKTEEVYRLTLGLSSLDFFRNDYKKINLFIEERNGFSLAAAEKWIEDWYKQLEIGAYHHPSIITFYPRIEIKVSEKSNPGIQVVDFILWAFNRSSRTVPDDRWKNLLDIKMHSVIVEEKGPQSGGKYYINKEIGYSGRFNYPANFKETVSNEEFINCYITIEHIIRQLLDDELPEHVSHLVPKLTSIGKKILNKKHNFNHNTIDEIVSTYLRFFDTRPIYDSVAETDISTWELLLKTKWMAGLILRHGYIESARSSAAICRWRRVALLENPDFFSSK